jgi:hypothetical protein
VKKMIGLVMMMGLVVSFVGCGDDDSVPTASSVSQDMYAETIVGTWEHMGEAFWTFSSDGTVEFIGWDIFYNWEISGSTLTITDSDDGTLYSEYPYEIESMSNNRLVYIQTFDKVDGSGTFEDKITMTR